MSFQMTGCGCKLAKRLWGFLMEQTDNTIYLWHVSKLLNINVTVKAWNDWIFLTSANKHPSL